MFAPTATFLARMTGKGPSSAKAPPPAKSEVLRQSMVQRILNSPQVWTGVWGAVAGGEGRARGQSLETRGKEEQAKLSLL